MKLIPIPAECYAGAKADERPRLPPLRGPSRQVRSYAVEVWPVSLGPGQSHLAQDDRIRPSHGDNLAR
jgi:hypothetical protein